MEDGGGKQVMASSLLILHIFNEDSSSDHVTFGKKYHFLSKIIQEATSKIESMNYLEKFKRKHDNNLQKTQLQEE